MKAPRFGAAALAALSIVACSFKPTRGGTENAYFTLKYERPTPGQVKFTYNALFEHDLIEVCASLLRYKHGSLLGRDHGYIAGTPKHCFVTPTSTMMPGDTQTFYYDFPKADWLGDERKDMPGIEFKVGYRAPPDWEAGELVECF